MIEIAIPYDAARMSCVFTGIMLVMGSSHRWIQGSHKDEFITIPWSSLNLRAFLLGLVPIFAFMPALLQDYNVWLSATPNPYLATIAVHLLLVTEGVLARSVAKHRAAATRLIFSFYVFGLVIAGLKSEVWL